MVVNVWRTEWREKWSEMDTSWRYWLIHIVVPPMGLQTPSALKSFSNSFIGDRVLSPVDDCKHPLLYLSGTGRASQGTAISGSCQQALIGLHNSVWVW